MQYYRWWSINTFYVLAPGQAQLAASLTDPSQWLSVFGERADSSPGARAGFEVAKSDLGAVGFTFGGGCFYGHGVNLLGGTARFHVRSLAVPVISAMPAWWSCSRRRDGKGKVGRLAYCRAHAGTQARFVSTGFACLIWRPRALRELGRLCAPSTPERWHVKAKKWPQTAKSCAWASPISPLPAGEQPPPPRLPRQGCRKGGAGLARVPLLPPTRAMVTDD